MSQAKTGRDQMKKLAYLTFAVACFGLTYRVDSALSQTVSVLPDCKQITGCSPTQGMAGGDCGLNISVRKCNNVLFTTNLGCNNRPHCETEGGPVNNCSCSCEGSAPDFSQAVIAWDEGVCTEDL